MAHGGSRPGAGRKKNGANRLSQEAAEKAADGLSPLDYLLSVLRNEANELATRVDAAKAAAPYCHPRRAPVDGEGKEQTLTIYVNKDAD